MSSFGKLWQKSKWTLLLACIHIFWRDAASPPFETQQNLPCSLRRCLLECSFSLHSNSALTSLTLLLTDFASTFSSLWWLTPLLQDWASFNTICSKTVHRSSWSITWNIDFSFWSCPSCLTLALSVHTVLLWFFQPSLVLVKPFFCLFTPETTLIHVFLSLIVTFVLNFSPLVPKLNSFCKTYRKFCRSGWADEKEKAEFQPNSISLPIYLWKTIFLISSRVFSSALSLPLSAAPSTVPIMHQVSATMRSITLSWPQPEQPNGIILDYEIRYYEKVSQPCLQACKIQGQPLLCGWQPAEGLGIQAGGSPDGGRNLVTEARGSLRAFPSSASAKASSAQVLSAPAQERTFQHPTPLSWPLTGLWWMGKTNSILPVTHLLHVFAVLQTHQCPLNFLKILWFCKLVFFKVLDYVPQI